MSPALADEDFVMVSRYPWTRFKEGQMVLVDHPKYKLMVKRICKVIDDKCLLMGDHFTSLSAEKMGWVEEQRIIGKVIYHIPAS